MRFLLIFLLFFLLQNCSKHKTVLICGNHVCVNKAEAEQYFEDNLSIEVKIVNKKKKENINLVELNLKDNSVKNKKINIKEKNKTNEEVKILTKNQIKKIKKNVNKKKKNKKLSRKIIHKNSKNNNKLLKKNDKTLDNKKKIKPQKDTYKLNNKEVDVCTIIEKCSIDEISKFLLKQGKKKGFPDITERQ